MQITLDDLASSVTRAASQPLVQLEEASLISRHLGELGDQLVDHFVSLCRASGHSWADIGERLGVTRQAAQKRFAPDGHDGAHPPTTHASPGVRIERHRREHHGKYRPLWKWLQEQEADRVETTFEQIEQLLGFPLPPSSRRHQPHWHSYEGSAVVRAIIDAGWRAQNVDLQNERVDFVRA